jgi:hypothetical protein
MIKPCGADLFDQPSVRCEHGRPISFGQREVETVINRNTVVSGELRSAGG